MRSYAWAAKNAWRDCFGPFFVTFLAVQKSNNEEKARIFSYLNGMVTLSFFRCLYRLDICLAQRFSSCGWRPHQVGEDANHRGSDAI